MYTNNLIDNNLLEKLPKKYWKHITYLEKVHNEIDNSTVYFFEYVDDDGNIGGTTTADTLSELKWTLAQLEKDITLQF